MTIVLSKVASMTSDTDCIYDVVQHVFCKALVVLLYTDILMLHDPTNYLVIIDPKFTSDLPNFN